MKRLLIIIATTAALTAQNNIQASMYGGTLLNKCMMVSEEIGYFDEAGPNVLRAEQDTDPLQVFFKNWIITFEDGEANTRYELTQLVEFSSKGGSAIIRYKAIFYGFAVNYDPRAAQVKLIITPKRVDLSFFTDEIYRSHRLSFL